MLINKKGFTLIELLVVIAIIGILATVIFAALGETRKKSRDAARQSQITEIGNAMELYYAEFGRYPATIQGVVDSGYMSTLPLDPINNAYHFYEYQVCPGGAGYALFAYPETRSFALVVHGRTDESYLKRLDQGNQDNSIGAPEVSYTGSCVGVTPTNTFAFGCKRSDYNNDGQITLDDVGILWDNVGGAFCN